MRAELEQQLYDDFPLLYRSHRDPQSAMRHGISCDNGWYTIIHDLSRTLERMIEAMESAKQQRCVALQIKEKLGGLRVYLSGADDAMHEAVCEAERMAAVTCERCGEDGSLGGDTWLVTLCPGCRVEYERQFRARLLQWGRRDSGVGMHLNP